MRVAVLVTLTLPVSGAAGDRDSLKGDMKFAAQAAQGGLWREALFRWERQLKAHPENARLHNNIAVAYEGNGDYARALEEYAKARSLAPDSKEIRANQEALQELCRVLKVCEPGKPAGGVPE